MVAVYSTMGLLLGSVSILLSRGGMVGRDLNSVANQLIYTSLLLGWFATKRLVCGLYRPNRHGMGEGWDWNGGPDISLILGDRVE